MASGACSGDDRRQRTQQMRHQVSLGEEPGVVGDRSWAMHQQD
jgi:hypothetical protein